MKARFSVFALVAIASSAAWSNAAPVHVIAYGDSGVAGKGVPHEQAYPAQLERMLRGKGLDVHVTNMGANGRTSADGLAEAANIPAADVVIVQFGINDIKHGVSADVVRRNIEGIVSKLVARGSKVLLVGNPKLDLGGVASAHGAAYVAWGGLPDPKYHVPGDPQNHFNAAGLQVMAQRMVGPIEQLLGNKR